MSNSPAPYYVSPEECEAIGSPVSESGWYVAVTQADAERGDTHGPFTTARHAVAAVDQARGAEW